MDERKIEAAAQRRELIKDLLDHGWEHWDMHPNGDERFHRDNQMVTVKWDAETGAYVLNK